MSGVFITATDTEVGKTAFGCALALALRRRGLDVGVIKPVASGCARGDGTLRLEDAERLRAASGSTDDLSYICPVALPEPLSPHLAAARAGLSIERELILVAYNEISRGHEFVIAEGVGGLLVPITTEYRVADLAGDLGLPLIVVARWGLGTINHTLLTLAEARRRKLPVAGLVLNECTGRAHGVAEQTAPAELRRLTGETILAQIPYVAAEHPADLYERMSRQISAPALDHILAAAGTAPAAIPGWDGPLPDMPPAHGAAGDGVPV